MVKLDRARQASLKVWVQQQYIDTGFKDGKPLGKEMFKKQLLSRLPNEFKVEVDKAREFVNTIYREGALLDVVAVDRNAVPPPVHVAAAGPVSKKTTQKAKQPGESVPRQVPPVQTQTAPINPQVNGPMDQTGGAAGGVPLDGPPKETPPPAQATIISPQIKELKAFVESLQKGTEAQPSNDQDSSQSSPDPLNDTPSLGEQLCLLNSDNPEDFEDTPRASASDISNATIFSSTLLENPTWQAILPQYALLGTAFPAHPSPSFKPDRRLFLNTNIPWSTFICGVQGSGKSHTMSCLIENCLIPTRTLGVLKRPLSALVFYLGQYTSRLNFRPCEAAFLAYSAPQFSNTITPPSVRVLVSPSNFPNLHAAYTQIPGVTVHPLRLQPHHLNVAAMLALMSVDTSQSEPLYMAQVVKVLRDMAAAGGDFVWPDFKHRLKKMPLNMMQRRPLEQRMELLESFLDVQGGGEDCFAFGSGGVTVVDLSCPFVDENTACVLFNICMGVYLQTSSDGVGKIVAVDEAHKYLTKTPAAKILTESLLSAIRQQRHYGARVVISTQEPTISPRLIDLCSVVVTHRFTSPEWFAVLRKHISTPGDEDAEELFARIVDLKVGEALVFAPLGVVSVGVEDPVRLNSGLVRVKVRKRLTWDGGRSVVCL